VIATWKMAGLLGGAGLLAGCAPMEEPVYGYYPVYRPIHRQVYVSRPPVVDPSDDSEPQAPVVQPESSPEPDKSWSDWSPISPAKAGPQPAPPQPPSPPPLVGADPTCGWWRVCNLWENTNEQ
jgi:hypothetical protein